MRLANLSMNTNTEPVLLRDIGQSSGRIRESTITDTGKHLAFTMTPKQLAVTCCRGKAPRLLLGEEALLFQGYPTAAVPDLVEETPQHVLADLAGNAVSVPVLLALLMSVVVAVDWRPGGGDESESGDEEADAAAAEDAEHALGLLASGAEAAEGLGRAIPRCVGP